MPRHLVEHYNVIMKEPLTTFTNTERPTRSMQESEIVQAPGVIKNNKVTDPNNMSGELIKIIVYSKSFVSTIKTWLNN